MASMKKHILGATLLGMVAVLTAALTAAAPPDTRVAEAARQGDRELVRTLLKQGVDANAPQGDGMTALHWAAYRDDAELAQMLLYAGARVSATIRINSMTPLFFASQNGSPRMVDLLLKAGADVNATLTNGATPLMYAARAGNAEAVKLLLENGANPNAWEHGRGETPLAFAAANNRHEAIKVLLANGANPAIATRVIDIAARNAAARGGRGGRGEPGGPQAAQGQRGARGAGANINQDERPPEVEFMGGLTPLLFAARQGHFESVKSLVEGGADINGVSAGDKSSPLLVATINGHFDLAMWLLNNGANPKLASTSNATPLYTTLNVKWAPHAEYPQPETKNEKTSYLDLMQAMLDRGADPNVQIKSELWYTFYASSRTNTNAGGATPFWRAAQASDVEAMRLLLRAGADAKIRSSDGSTALHTAAGAGVHGNQEVTKYGTWMPGVRYLVDELGVDVNERDGKGLTALHHAAGRGDNEMVLYLVTKGADIGALGKNGESVADMANGPRQRVQPFPETLALVTALGSTNSRKCVSC